MYAELWETDRIAKSEREEQEEKNLIERNRECLKVWEISMLSKRFNFVFQIQPTYSLTFLIDIVDVCDPKRNIVY